jgi:hypothetical protein
MQPHWSAFESLDPDPDPHSKSRSGSGSRRAKLAKLYKLFRHHWLHIVIWYSYMYQTSANYRSSVADPGCLSRIPDPTFSIPDPNCLHPGSRIRIKELKYFNPKKPNSGSGSWLSTHPGSRGQKGTGSRIRIRNTDRYHTLIVYYFLSLLL